MGEPRRLFDNVYALEEEGVRSFLVTGSRAALLLDTGMGDYDFEGQLPKLTTLPITLVNTHADGDHTGKNHLIKTRYIHPGDLPHVLSTRPNVPGEYLPLADGQVFDLGGATLRVVTCPGHTPGSVALLYEERNVLFSGDTVSEAEIFMFSPDRDHRTFIASLKKLAGLDSQVKTILPCHGPCPLTGLAELARDEIAAVEAFLAGEKEDEVIHLVLGPDGRDAPYVKCYRRGRAAVLCAFADNN